MISDKEGEDLISIVKEADANGISRNNILNVLRQHGVTEHDAHKLIERAIGSEDKDTSTDQHEFLEEAKDRKGLEVGSVSITGVEPPKRQVSVEGLDDISEDAKQDKKRKDEAAAKREKELKEAQRKAKERVTKKAKQKEKPAPTPKKKVGKSNKQSLSERLANMDAEPSKENKKPSKAPKPKKPSKPQPKKKPSPPPSAPNKKKGADMTAAHHKEETVRKRKKEAQSIKEQVEAARNNKNKAKSAKKSAHLSGKRQQANMQDADARLKALKQQLRDHSDEEIEDDQGDAPEAPKKKGFFSKLFGGSED